MEGGIVGHNFENGPTKDHFSQIWFNRSREVDLNVIFIYQTMTNLHNRYKSVERKISKKKRIY